MVFGCRGVCLCGVCMVFVGLTFGGAWCIVFLAGAIVIFRPIMNVPGVLCQ